jgi:hypothetical protein
MKKSFLFFRLLTGLAMLGSMITFSGCMAAIPLIQAGFVAHSATKAVQMATEGDIEMSIGENEIPSQNKLVLSQISKLAIWPDEGPRRMVVVADELQKLGAFDSIITPSKVTFMVSDFDFNNQSLNNLTYKEKLATLQKACEQTGSEAIVVFEDLNYEIKMKMFSFNRASTDLKGKISVFELKTNQIIYSSTTDVSVGMGEGNISQKEIMAVMGKRLAQKIVSLKTQTIAQK